MTTSGIDARERLVLDTSAFSHLRAGHEETLEIVSAAERVFLPVIVLGELEAGFTLGTRTRENQIALSEFLAESFVSILEVTPEVSRRYGRLFASLRRRGTPIPVNDIWIAACALSSGAPLLSFDRDFLQVSELELLLLSA